MLSSIKRASICYSLCILFSYWWEQRERKKARRFSVAVAIYVRLLRLLRQWRNPSHSSQPKRLRLGNTLWLWTSNDSTFSSWCVRSIVLLGKLEWKTSRSQRREFFFVVVKSWLSVFFSFFLFYFPSDASSSAWTSASLIFPPAVSGLIRRWVFTLLISPGLSSSLSGKTPQSCQTAWALREGWLRCILWKDELIPNPFKCCPCGLHFGLERKAWIFWPQKKVYRKKEKKKKKALFLEMLHLDLHEPHMMKPPMSLFLRAITKKGIMQIERKKM